MPHGLRHADDTRPGYTRKRIKQAFAYFDASGKRIDDANEIARIDALAIPPAYSDVWVCPDPRGHVQATGRDARGRKQYRYHPQWRETRDADKYDRMAAFARALPKIRTRVARDLRRDGMPRDKVIAAIVQFARQHVDSCRQCRICARKSVVWLNDFAQEAPKDRSRQGSLSFHWKKRASSTT